MPAVKALHSPKKALASPQPGLLEKHPILADLLIALLIAVPYGFHLLGAAVIDPADISWMRGDSAGSYIASAMFRENTRPYWPLSFTPNLGYPVGETIAIEDANPVLAILFWPFSRALPTNFQYFGAYMLLSQILQLFVAILLIRSFVGRGKRIAVVLGATLFLISPPLIYRCSGHFSLTSHWFILLGLLFYRLCLTGLPFRRKLIYAVALSALAASINPYLLAMVLGLVFAALTVDAVRAKTVVPGSIILAASLAATIVCLYSIGFMTGATGDYIASGYRSRALDLLSPIAPIFGSLVLQNVPVLEYEGFNYLGLGVILLFAALIPVWIEHYDWGKPVLKRYWPLLGVAVIYTLLALSTEMRAAGRVFLDVDPRQRLTPILGMLRGSGRLFWIAFYSIDLMVVISCLRFLKYRTACVLLAICVALQYADSAGTREATRSALSSGPLPEERLYSPVWDRLGPQYKHLSVLPGYQCGEYSMPSPRGRDGWQPLGLLAASRGMTINSYYAPRNRSASLIYHCETEIELLRTKPLAPDTAYVVTSGVAALIEEGPSGSGKCMEADRSILCTAEGFPDEKKRWAVPLADSQHPGLPDIGKYLLSGFANYDPGFGAWSSGEGDVAFRLNSDQLRSAGSVKLVLFALAAKEPVVFAVEYDTGKLKGSYTGWPAASVGSFELHLPIDRANEVQVFRIRSFVLHTPAEILHKPDQRRLGLGIRAVALSTCPASNDIFGDNAKPLPECAKAIPPAEFTAAPRQ